MDKIMNLTYASSLSDLCEINSSFDKGILKIAYHGENRNGSFISKETFEKCIKTIYNCPIACSYDRESGTLGGHDMDVARDENGTLKLVNVTEPIGVIPESANVFWETVEEDDGTKHEYLCADALLWKRQEAYCKIRADGYAAQSMEIMVRDGETKGENYIIKDFEFTAFILIGVEPCFESAALEFSKQNFKQQFSQMMREIKESVIMAESLHKDDINSYDCTEGGERIMNEETALESEIKTAADTGDTSNTEGGVEDNAVSEQNDKFALEGAVKEELERILSMEERHTDYGDISHYIFVDYDKDVKNVYFWDTSDWCLYGCVYTMNGDAITIDYGSKKRKKYEIVDYEGGEQASPVSSIFSTMESKLKKASEYEAKYSEANEKIKSMEKELQELKSFKAQTEADSARAKREEVFSKFNDLCGTEAFEALKENSDELDIDVLEEKCFAIRGRKLVTSAKTPKLKVDAVYDSSKGEGDKGKSPYGKLFEKYGEEK